MPQNEDSDDEVRRLSELVTRCDERIRSCAESQRSLERRDELLEAKVDSLAQDVREVNARSEKIAEKLKKSDGRWEMLFDGAWKIALTVIGAWILYMLNIKT